MSTIRIPEPIVQRIEKHLFTDPGEHFGFLLARHAESLSGPVFLVDELCLIGDEFVDCSGSVWGVQFDAILPVINRAAIEGRAVVEFHNHPLGPPRFSATDRIGYEEFVPYVLGSLPGRPYAATVWTPDGVYGEVFRSCDESTAIRSVTAHGQRLRQLVAPRTRVSLGERFDRQLDWLTPESQAALGSLRIAIVGLGGTGSVMAQTLAYLGVADFLLVDNDSLDATSMNRVVTASAADVDTAKTVAARRTIRSVRPAARVHTLSCRVPSEEAFGRLKEVDVVVSCVDNDGARLVLNELCLAYRIPLLDLGVGIDAENGVVDSAGGRVAVVLGDGPCLNCMGEIDAAEARYFLETPAQRARTAELGYVGGLDAPSPSVVTLNTAIAGCAGNEFLMLISGVRAPSPFIELDLLGLVRPLASQWLTPRRVESLEGCVQCAMRGLGDDANLDRYTKGGAELPAATG